MRVLIAGDMYGCLNVGDDAIMESVVGDVRSVFPEFEILVSAGDSAPPIEVEQVRKIPLYGKMIKLKSIWQSDFLICGGGSILSDCPYFSLDFVRAALFLGKKVFIYGVGMNEISDRKTRKYVVKYVDKESKNQ